MNKYTFSNDCPYYQIPKIVKCLSPSEWVLFTVLFDGWKIMKNEDGWFFRSEKELSEESGLSVSTIKRTIKKLLEKGVILTTYYNDGVKLATYNKANEYKINMEKVVKLNPFKGVQNEPPYEKEGVQNEKEGVQNEPPYNNKEIINKYSLDSNVTIDTLQVSGVDTPNETIPNEERISFIEDESSPDDITDNNITKKENEMSDERTNGMNVMSECNERQANKKKNITSTSVDKDNASKDEHKVPVVIPNKSIKEFNAATATDKYARWRNKYGQIQIGKNIYQTPEDYIGRLKKNMDIAKNQMLNDKYKDKDDNIQSWKTQYEFLGVQMRNLKTFDYNEYENYKKNVLLKWWDNTKEYFPSGWEKVVKESK